VPVVGEGDTRGGSAVALVVGDDLNTTIVLPDADTAIKKPIKSQSEKSVVNEEVTNE
jgi:hypothetical protein